MRKRYETSYCDLWALKSYTHCVHSRYEHAADIFWKDLNFQRRKIFFIFTQRLRVKIVYTYLNGDSNMHMMLGILSMYHKINFEFCLHSIECIFIQFSNFISSSCFVYTSCVCCVCVLKFDNRKLIACYEVNVVVWWWYVREIKFLGFIYSNATNASLSGWKRKK